MTEYRLGFMNPKDCDLLQYIVDGKKTVEGRRLNDKLKLIKPKDILIFKTKTKNVECTVTKVTVYKSFDEFLKKEKVATHMPCVKKVEDAKKIYDSFHKGEVKGEYIAIGIKFSRQIFYRGVKEPWYTAIKESVKKIEGRLDRGSFSQMKEGDTVFWTNNKIPVETKITKIEKFKSFRDMLSKKGYLEICLPGIESVDEGVKVYREYYPDEKIEKELGVLAIHLKRTE